MVSTKGTIVRSLEGFKKLIEKKRTFHVPIGGDINMSISYTIHKVVYDNPKIMMYKAKDEFSGLVYTVSLSELVSDSFPFGRAIRNKKLIVEEVGRIEHEYR